MHVIEERESLSGIKLFDMKIDDKKSAAETPRRTGLKRLKSNLRQSEKFIFRVIKDPVNHFMESWER